MSKTMIWWDTSDVLRFLANGIEYIWNKKRKVYVSEDGTDYLFHPPYGIDFTLLETGKK